MEQIWEQKWNKMPFLFHFCSIFVCSDDIIPDGTMVMTVDRISGSASDKYYILPKTNVHLRLIKECERYKACLDLFDGNEHLALREFWEREKCRKQQAKLIR